MTVHLVTFSDQSMSESAWRCEISALRNGATLSTRWPHEVFRVFPICEENKSLFGQPRGLGYWAWKPWIVLNVMSTLGKGDILIYADAGVEFINNVSHIIDRMDQDVFLFGNNWEHAHWCKRDVVPNVWPVKWFLDGGKPHYSYPVPDGAVAYDPTDGGMHWHMFGKQVQASVIFFRVSDYTRAFVKEWLDWCLFEGGRLIDDSPSRLPNHPEFQEHRHDQAILTTMAYREGIKIHYWPASYNDGAFSYEKLPCYAGDNYPILFNHHRRRNHEWMNAA